MTAVNPFDAANLTVYQEANHILNWYARLTPALRQRCVDTILDTDAVLEFIGQATQHLEHNPEDFNQEALDDLHKKMWARMSRSSKG